MSEEKPVDPAWLFGFGAFLAAVLGIYLLTVSQWYWCGAQIDPATLRPVCLPAATPPANQPRADGGQGFEARAWPDFGENNNAYNGLNQFWGDDLISRFMQNVFDAAARVARPFVVEDLIPAWNRAMAPPINRKTLYGALTLLLGVMTTEWAKDVYRALRREKSDPSK